MRTRTAMSGGSRPDRATLRRAGVSAVESMEARRLLSASIALLSGDSDPEAFMCVEDVVYFTADDGVAGRALWKTDGTAEGTVRAGAVELPPPENNFVANGVRYEFIEDDGGNLQLWRDDGTATGTFVLTDFQPSFGGLMMVGQLAAVGDVVYFGMYLAVGYDSVFVDSDGTAEPVIMPLDSGPAYYSCELWRTDGTVEGTRLVLELDQNANLGASHFVPGSLSNLGGMLGFLFVPEQEDWSSPQPLQLWTSDGSADGTEMMYDFGPGVGDEGWSNAAELNGELIFRAPTPGGGREPWISDGTAAGTRVLKDINTVNELWIRGPEHWESDWPLSRATVRHVGNTIHVQFGSLDGQFDAGEVERVRVHANYGMASLNMSGLQRPAMVDGSIPWVIGGYDDDVIRCSPRFAMGSWGNDYIVGSGFEDQLYGNAGNDTIYGDWGDDAIYGDEGDDLLINAPEDWSPDDGSWPAYSGCSFIYGGDGNDRIYGCCDPDMLDGGRGDDLLQGFDGNDRLLGRQGNDTLLGDDGRDLLNGGTGNDKLYGGAGRDDLLGVEGNDTLYGEGGNDRLFGGKGHDRLDGGVGADWLDGHVGRDTVHGGSGNDWFTARDGHRDRLFGESGFDYVIGDPLLDELTGMERFAI